MVYLYDVVCMTLLQNFTCVPGWPLARHVTNRLVSISPIGVDVLGQVPSTDDVPSKLFLM